MPRYSLYRQSMELKKDRVVRIIFLVALMFSVLSASASSLLLVSVSDPAGDDFGDGSLIYPQRDDFRAGDLDLLQLQISRDDQGFWFEAVMKNPIRDPANVHATVGGDSLADAARKGFYQFNIDVYVDTDRIDGSGNTFTLPGRKVRIDAEYAWEKTVILTPRPELMRQQLIGVLTEQYPDRKVAEIEASVDQSLFFPARIKVRGKTIAFFVPASFFGGSEGGNWAATALVTGAIPTVSADFSLFPSTKKPLDILQLGVMQPVQGHPKDTFGYSERQSSPVVDLLGASAEQQVRQLAEKEDLIGVSWGSQDAPDKSPVAVSSVLPVARLLQPEAVAVAKPAESNVAEVKPNSDGAIARRLQSLQQLYEQKLIDEAEYKQQKQRILNEL